MTSAMRAPLASPPARPPWNGPAYYAALAYFGRPRTMHETIRYALLWAADAAPVAFPTLGRLARRLHAARAGRPLQLVEEPLQFADEAEPRLLVHVFTLGETGQPDATIGYAWLGAAPRPRERLQAALDALQPRRADQEEAA